MLSFVFRAFGSDWPHCHWSAVALTPQKCWPLCFKSANLGHILVHACFCSRLAYGHTNRKTIQLAQLIPDDNRLLQLLPRLSSAENVKGTREHLVHIKMPFTRQKTERRTTGSGRLHKVWISSKSVVLSDARRTVPLNVICDEVCQSLGNQLTRSISNDCEQWLTESVRKWKRLRVSAIIKTFSHHLRKL